MAGEQEPTPLPPEGTAPEHGENRKVTVRGRIGQAPQFRTLPEKETLVGNFSLAEHPEPQDPQVTVWHTIVVFGDRAQQVEERFARGDLKVGQEVAVVGYVHRRERP